MSNTVAIVDYGSCNLDSVFRAIEHCGAVARIVRDAEGVREAGPIILPGVGTFSIAIARLTAMGLDEACTRRVREDGVPFLGICLGMQLIAERGIETVPRAGLGWIAGDVTQLESHAPNERVPHVGWNEVAAGDTCPLFAGLPENCDFYFTHSYHFTPANESDIAGTTPFAGSFCSAVMKDNIFGVQFHPEKSLKHGLSLLNNFLAL